MKHDATHVSSTKHCFNTFAEWWLLPFHQAQTTPELRLLMYKVLVEPGIYFRPVMEVQWFYRSYVGVEIFACLALYIWECGFNKHEKWSQSTWNQLLQTCILCIVVGWLSPIAGDNAEKRREKWTTSSEMASRIFQRKGKRNKAPFTAAISNCLIITLYKQTGTLTHCGFSSLNFRYLKKSASVALQLSGASHLDLCLYPFHLSEAWPGAVGYSSFKDCSWDQTLTPTKSWHFEDAGKLSWSPTSINVAKLLKLVNLHLPIPRTKDLVPRLVPTDSK